MISNIAVRLAPLESPLRRRAAAFRNAIVAVCASRWAKPIGRACLLGVGLVVLAFIGSSTFARAPALAATPPLAASALSPPARTVELSTRAAEPPPASMSPPALSPRRPATAEDPVVLNTASVDELRRLPGIGAKRAQAIFDLRARLGRFRQVEDLMKVKGIGKGKLRKIRPVVRIDAPTTPDAGTSR